jgi:hypothetical protein
VPGQKWDLIVTMDDATNEHYAMFFVAEEGTASSLRGVREVIESRGAFLQLLLGQGESLLAHARGGGQRGQEKSHPIRAG